MLDHLGAASCMLAQNLQEGDYKGVFLQVFDGILSTGKIAETAQNWVQNFCRGITTLQAVPQNIDGTKSHHFFLGRHIQGGQILEQMKDHYLRSRTQFLVDGQLKQEWQAVSIGKNTTSPRIHVEVRKGGQAQSQGSGV